nr:MAG TPA: hypothetical protein [Caudoviricetes sp.]
MGLFGTNKISKKRQIAPTYKADTPYHYGKECLLIFLRLSLWVIFLFFSILRLTTRR